MDRIILWIKCHVLPQTTGAWVESNICSMDLKYHKAGLTPTTPVTSTAISPIKMSIGRKSPTDLCSEMFLQGKPFFCTFLLSTPPYWQLIFRFCWQRTTPWPLGSESRLRDIFRLSVVLGYYHCLTKHIWEVHIWTPCNLNLECL
jgi:hypothetical protein